MTRALQQVLLLAGLFCAGRVLGCGIAWELPQNHFDGVNEQGYVSYWEKIGEIDLGDDLKLSLNINFCSNRESSSPELGQGWILALLDSNIVQYDDNHFAMCEPDGLLQRLKRDSSDPTLLKGGGWMAQISGDRITAWTECGWKLVFDHGKLVSMQTPKNEELDISYQDGKPAELLENGSIPLLTVERDAQTGEATALSFGGKKVLISQDQRPMIEKMEGKNLIGAMGRSLHRLTLQDGSTRSYDFAVDDTLTPTLAVGAPVSRTFTWDAASKLLIKDGDWTYSITQGEKPFDNAAIGRVNGNRQREYWWKDSSRGSEVTQDASGKRTTTNWFTSGLLSGKVRTITEQNRDSIKTVYRASYDEQGAVAHEDIDGMPKRQTVYDKSLHELQFFQGDEMVAKEDFTNEGNPKSITYIKGNQIYSFNNNQNP